MSNILDDLQLKPDLIIVLSEHESFEKKIKSDFSFNRNCEVIYARYTGKKIVSSSIFYLVKRACFKKSLVISEYFNFIPRFLSLITFSKSISIVYGVVTERNFRNFRNYKLSFLNKFLNSLYADIFIVVNRKYSFELFRKYFKNQKIYLKNFDRKFSNQKINNNYCMWISQCWKEDGNLKIEDLQIKAIRNLNLHCDLKIVMHPRDTSFKYKNYENDIIYSLNNAIDYCELNGFPKYVFGIASSALLEFTDYNCNVIRFENSESIDFSKRNIELKSLKVISFSEIKNLFD